MTPHEINILIERYLDGETTPAEERELALAVQQEDRPTEWAIIAEMLGELTVDEAQWTHQNLRTLPQPLPEWRGEVATSINSSQETAVSTPLHSDFCPSITRGARGEWGRGWVRWAAAACVALAFGLSYNIIKETQETAKVETPPSAQPKPENKPATKPLLASKPKPTPQKPQRQIEQPPVEAQPFEASVKAQLLEAQAEAPLPEPQPQLIAELEEATPPEDLSLCMALIAEVEARAALLQQTQQTHPLSLPSWRGEVTTSIHDFSEDVVSTPLPHREGLGVGHFLLDELLANIQQLSNRPELSL